jgi:uncharacterized protein YdbL (DUF1318 family)
MKKSVLLLAVLALASISIAFAKSYAVNLSHSVQAGAVELKAGSYHVKVDGDKAIFTDLDSNKEYSVPVKIENAAKKFEYTRIDETVNGSVSAIKTIQLGGSTTKLNF